MIIRKFVFKLIKLTYLEQSPLGIPAKQLECPSEPSCFLAVALHEAVHLSIQISSTAIMGYQVPAQFALQPTASRAATPTRGLVASC
jgi:hypothetical protein